MCLKTECLDSISAKKACLVLSIIIAIGNGCLLLFCFYLWDRYFSYDANNSDGDDTRDAIDDYLRRAWSHFSANYWLSAGTLCTAVTFVFSLVLCYGVYKNRPGHVKAYYVFGVVATILVALGSIVLLVRMWIGVNFSGSWGLYALFPCVLHSLFLVLVYRTHDQLIKDDIAFNVQLLEVASMLPSAPQLYMLE